MRDKHKLRQGTEAKTAVTSTSAQITTGTIKQRAELNKLYKKSEERDSTRDYREVEAGFGSSPPEGLSIFLKC